MLVTDLSASVTVDELPVVIDAAVPLWRERFGVDEKDSDEWRLRVCLIGESARFETAGLMPVGRVFAHGLALGHEAWLHEQPSDYYRRCLVLHEATHSFMMTTLGGCGPPWYMEGMAELLGAHRWDSESGRLTLGVIPDDKRDAPMWGRVKLIRDAVERGAALSPDAIFKIDNRTQLSTETYSWAWALSALCDHHPRYQTPWRSLTKRVLDDNFDRRFSQRVMRERDRFDQEWRHFVHTIDYGYDFTREAIAFRDGQPISAEPIESEVRADRGWQSSGVRVEAGRPCRIVGTGRYVIHTDADGVAWPCEPSGVTLKYHDGRPLGELLATVDHGPDAFLDCEPIGLGKRYTPHESGTLYFRVNDAPNGLADNRGTLTVRVSAD